MYPYYCIHYGLSLTSWDNGLSFSQVGITGTRDNLWVVTTYRGEEESCGRVAESRVRIWEVSKPGFV